jgi:hypothetical protein
MAAIIHHVMVMDGVVEPNHIVDGVVRWPVRFKGRWCDYKR